LGGISFDPSLIPKPKTTIMKKLIVLIIVTAISGTTFCQVDPGNEPQNKLAAATYRVKARKQKTAAWICLGGGFLAMSTAAVIGGTKATGDWISTMVFGEEEPSNYTGETILAVVGGAAILGSIPLFISAAHNKHKARLMMTEQKTAMGLPIAVPKTIPSLTLRVSL